MAALSKNLLYIGAELKCATAESPLQDLRDGVALVQQVATRCLHEIVHGQQISLAYHTILEAVLQEGGAE